MRHKNIAVRAGVQAVDHARGKAVVEYDQRSPVRRYGHIQTGQAGNAARPGAGGVDHALAGDFQAFAADAVAGRHAAHFAVTLMDGRDFMISHHPTAVTPSGHGVVQRQTETVHAGIGHAEDAADVRGKIRFQTQGFGHVQFLRVNARFAAGFGPGLHIGRVVARRQSEKSFGFLHTLPADAPNNHVLFNTFARGFIVVDRIAAPAVQQPVKTRTGAVGKAALFQQNGGHAAHAQIAQRAHARSAAANDDNRGLQHGAS